MVSKNLTLLWNYTYPKTCFVVIYCSTFVGCLSFSSFLLFTFIIYSFHYLLPFCYYRLIDNYILISSRITLKVYSSYEWGPLFQIRSPPPSLRISSRTLSLPKKLCYLLHWKPFKNDEKCFLFHLKSSFRSQDIWVFVMTFWSCWKNGLIRKINLTSKFMTSQPG